MSFKRWDKFFTETVTRLETEKQKEKIKASKNDIAKARLAGKASTGIWERSKTHKIRS